MLPAVARGTPSPKFKPKTTLLGSASGTTSSTTLSVSILSATKSNKPDYVQTEHQLSNLISKPFLDASTAKTPLQQGEDLENRRYSLLRAF